MIRALELKFNIILVKNCFSQPCSLVMMIYVSIGVFPGVARALFFPKGLAGCTQSNIQLKVKIQFPDV